MIVSIKALIVILAIAAVIFRVAKPIALRFSAERDFTRRRNVWFVLTVTAFLTPSFWLFVLVATPLLIWAGRKDANPVALYLLMLHVIPPILVEIPVVGINRLFDLDNYRLLSLCVLIPTAWRLRRSKDADRVRGLQAMDFLLLAYGVLQVFLFIPPDLRSHAILQNSLTNDLRSAFLFFVDIYVLYFVVSRSCSSRREMVDTLAAFCVACAVMATVAVFESMRQWLLYADFFFRWSKLLPVDLYQLRGSALRAQASAGHALALGYLLAIAFGLSLYLKSQVKSMGLKIGVTLLLWLGLLFSYSRGPWIGAVAIYFAFAAASPRALPGLFKAAFVAVLVAGIVAVSPLGDRIISDLPFLGGSVDAGSVIYRQRLAERSWELIKEHPFLGDQLALTKMEGLRQGQGIIDTVNTYAGVALDYGLIGLSIFVGFILTALFKAYRASKVIAQSDPDLALLGTSLTACIVGTLLMIANSSFMYGYEEMFYVLAGLATAYVRLCRLPERRAANDARGGRSQVLR